MSKLSEKGRKYSAESFTFKKTPRDLKRLELQIRDENYERDLDKILTLKQEVSERHSARRLERLIVQYKGD